MEALLIFWRIIQASLTEGPSKITFLQYIIGVLVMGLAAWLPLLLVSRAMWQKIIPDHASRGERWTIYVGSAFGLAGLVVIFLGIMNILSVWSLRLTILALTVIVLVWNKPKYTNWKIKKPRLKLKNTSQARLFWLL